MLQPANMPSGLEANPGASSRPPDAQVPAWRAALARGQRDAFEEVYRLHAEDVLRVLQSGLRYRLPHASGVVYLSDAYDAEEAVQDTFIALMKFCQDGRYDPSRPLKPLIFRIAAITALRRLSKFGREVPQSDIEILEHDEMPYERDEGGRLLKEFVGELSQEERSLLEHYFEDRKSQREVGASFGLSRDQVYRKIVKLRERASAFFRKRGWFDEL